MVSDIVWIIVSEALVMVLTVGAIAWWLSGYFKPFMIVKASRGKKILVGVHSYTHTYYVPGKVFEGFLVFKDASKDFRRVKVTEGVFYKSNSVSCCDIDDESNNFLTRHGEAEGYDAKKTESLFVRALYKPSILDKKEKLIIGLLIVVLLVLLGNVLLSYKVSTQMAELITKGISVQVP